MKLLAAKEWNKMFYENGQKYRIQVRSELVHRDGNRNAYFAIGGDIYRHAKNGRKVWEAGGCIHEDIIKHFPQLQPLVDIHLADEDGVPMHAYANAAYWAGQTKWQALDLDTLSKHLRISKDEANRLTTMVNSYYPENYETAWRNICYHFELTKQWNHQAQEAKALLNIMEEAQ